MSLPRPLLVAGPCVLESESMAQRVAAHVREVGERHKTRVLFKASFDKANRTSGSSYRGPGLAEGLEVFESVRKQTGIPVLTDVHEPSQAAALAQCVDALQIPAFLCRQTDLLAAAAATGLPVNLKKGQFMAPWQAGPAIDKLRSAGAETVWLTERGTTFGHGDLVVDFRGFPELRASGCPLLFDASHAAQQPGGHGDRSGGRRAWSPLLARAAAAAGADGLYLETHPKPSEALSDPDTQWPLDELDDLVEQFVRFWDLHRAIV